jgi:serine/threonine-protein kinase
MRIGCARLVCLAFTAVLFGAAAAAAQGGSASLGIAPVAADPELRPIARGYERWLRGQLDAAGIGSVALEGGLETALAAAAQQQLTRVLAPRLNLRGGRVVVQLALYAPQSGAVIGGSRADATLAEVGGACAESIDHLLAQLGVASQGETPPPLLDDLASASRALAAWEAGDWIGAWREVQGRLTPTAMGLREEIVEAARSGRGDMLQRARVLAAAGDPLEATRLVGRDATLALRADAPDPALLVAGGEVALARGDVPEARAAFERALSLQPGDTGATLGLAHALTQQGLADEARTRLERAAELDPSNPQPLALLATQSEERDPRAAAASWLAAGRRAAQQLEVQRAHLHFQRAISLDPTLASEASLETGTLEEKLGRPAEALAAYRQAAGADPPTPTLLVATGRMQRALGQIEPARGTLSAAMAITDQDPQVLSELGALELEAGNGPRAVELLRSARAVAENDPVIRERYAAALHTTGALDEAASLLAAPDASAAELGMAAEIQVTRGDLPAAQLTLTRAIELEPLDPALRGQNARLMDAIGAPEAAAAERSLAALIEGAPGGDGGAFAVQHGNLGALSLDELVASFAAQVPQVGARRVVSLGVREPSDLRSLFWRLLRPRGPDTRRVEQALQVAIDARFGSSGGRAQIGEELQLHVDNLFAFDQPTSLDAQTIAAVNQVLAADGVFVARLVARSGAQETLACDPGDFALELRFLWGKDPDLVSALSNVDCVRGGVATYAAWNYVAFALYAIGALLIGWPVIRGWGGIQVDIKLPERTKGFFSIHITRRSDAVKKERVSKKTGREKIKSGKLDFLKRFERHMAGRSTTFRMIPARKLPYTVTVAGPLLDARGEEIIGHFMEEQKAQVTRGRATVLTFDFCPRECAVEVRVSRDGRPAKGGRVAVEGDPSSLRYARDGVAYLYLAAGRYAILVGCADAATSIPLEIHNVSNAIPLQVDFERAEEIVFRDCPQAVDAFLQSDLASAAAALAANGQPEAASRLRATLYRRQGRHEEAAREFQAAGQLEDAAAMRASGDDHAGSGELYEQAGDFAHAAEAYRSGGQLEKAGHCYERAYDYARAIECWRELGDREREGMLLEKLGEYLEAAQLSRELGDPDRALALLGQVDTRHAGFSDACKLVAEIATERGDHDLAVSKLEQAIGDTGTEHASNELLEAYAGALERAARNSQALSAYETLRRRDASRTELATHIQRLRSAVESEATSQRLARTAPSAPAESRYELLGELGRGGMGVVYKARDRRLGRVVALKRLPENLKHHPQAVALFEREARAAAALNHRNIVTIFDAGEEDGTYFISMELLEGRPLSAILAKQRRLRAGDVLKLGVQISTGLHFAHERKIVHRDIKCANLFFTNERVVKIMDFGIAKSLEEVRRQATVVGGTPYYMAPEQAAGRPVDHRADLYAFGVTLFQLATGVLPFPDGDVSYRHRHEPAPDPREHEMELPEALANLILQLMAKTPDERPANAALVGETLRAILGQLKS